MRKDLWIGGIAATVAHSAAVWFSLFQTHPAAKVFVDVAPDPMVMIAPPPPPETVENADEVVDHRPPASVAPSLVDFPSPTPDPVFTQPIQPNVPVTADSQIRVIPDQGAFTGGADKPKIFNLKDLSQQPVPTVTPRPQYPFEMRRQGIGGTVTLDFIVDEHGAVERITALEGPANEFKVAAVEGLRHWRFRPGIKDGKAVRTHMQIPLVFSLQQ